MLPVWHDRCYRSRTTCVADPARPVIPVRRRGVTSANPARPILLVCCRSDTTCAIIPAKPILPVWRDMRCRSGIACATGLPRAMVPVRAQSSRIYFADPTRHIAGSPHTCIAGSSRYNCRSARTYLRSAVMSASLFCRSSASHALRRYSRCGRRRWSATSPPAATMHANALCCRSGTYAIDKTRRPVAIMILNHVQVI